MNWRRQLRLEIMDRFDESEIQSLCFDLDIEYEFLSSENKNDTVRELIEYSERHDGIPTLITYCKESRKNVPWDDIAAAAIRELTGVESGEATAPKEAAVEAKPASVVVPTQSATGVAEPTQPSAEAARPSGLVLDSRTIVIGVVGILVIIGAIYLLLRAVGPETASPPVADGLATQTRLETAITVVDEPTTEPTTELTDEPVLAATEIPPTVTEAPPTATATNEPTPEPTVEPTVEVVVQDEPTPEPTVEAEPTVLYPDGTPLELTYDPTSFYLYNPSSERVPVRNFSFETLDDAGRPLIFGLEGDRWTQFYSFVDSFACNGIEPFGVGGIYLRPQYCRSYNATITPEANGDELFWIERSGAVEFRVLWDGEEIARCPLGTNTCIVHVPAP
ncbi:MAG: hypothetical protein DHS20C20_34180 [Ardenticatenaceae bacterium]|nr:MAG: hypothetical protein DHS20C20_34180 [Ardenticatenaceae bacterium]